MNRHSSFHEDFTKKRYAPLTVLKAIMKELPDKPCFLALKILVENEEWLELANWETDPSHFLTAADFADHYQATSFLKKFRMDVPEIDKRVAAIEKWRAAEKQCSSTNDRLRARRDGHLFDHAIESILFDAGGIIASTLGTCPTPDYIANLGSFGPGVDLSSKGQTALNKKLSDPGQLTLGCFKTLVKAKCLDWPIFNYLKGVQPLPNFELVRHNRVTFVPKNTKTDRAIAVEPRWNIFFQKGLGNLLRRKLKRAGIDLDSQERNRELAASLDLATIDLSSASDTLSHGLVLDLLPYDWFCALEALRCSHSLLDGELVELDKFSSMGNGYTFELETLIFFALAKATCRHLGVDIKNLTVYGDDIIVPCSAYTLLERVLQSCGFIVNSKKSYSVGPFRESCGKHYFQGFNVTPFFLKEDPRDVEQITRFCNQISAYRGSVFSDVSRDRRWFAAHQRLVRFIPKNLRYLGPGGNSPTEPITYFYRGPDGRFTAVKNSGGSYISSVIFACIDEATPPRHRGPQGPYDAWVIIAPVFVPRKLYSNSLPLLYEKLLAPSGPGNFFTSRADGRWSLRKVTVHVYVEPGAWV